MALVPAASNAGPENRIRALSWRRSRRHPRWTHGGRRVVQKTFAISFPMRDFFAGVGYQNKSEHG